MSHRDIYMSDIKNVFGKLKYQTYDELSFEDKAVLSMAFSSQYSDVEIRYMLEELNNSKRVPVFTKEEVKKILENPIIPNFK